MSKKKPTPEVLQGRFNNAAFKFGLLLAKELLTPLQTKSISADCSAIDRIYDAKDALRHSSEADADKVAKGLELPLNQLKADFVRKVDYAVRKLDPEKLDPRTKKGLGL